MLLCCAWLMCRQLPPQGAITVEVQPPLPLIKVRQQL
jgi:hypothetical protein